jgi:hypothetical protein
MRTKFLVVALLLSTPALASHPHDRVCVGSAKLTGGDALELILQWEIGRAYDGKRPAEDSHTLSFEVRSCFSDEGDDSCRLFKDEVRLAGEARALVVPLKLKSADGRVLFEGKFDWNEKEKLVGSLDPSAVSTLPARGRVQVTMPLECVSQPKLPLRGGKR